MKTITTLKISIASLCLVFTSAVNSQAINEGFEDITTLVPGGWFLQNNSVPVGTTGWFQGNTGVFPAQAGAGYIGANFNNTTGANTISNWLVTPNRTFKNGDVITFYSRKTDYVATPPDYPDRLEVRLSTNGASTNVGTGGTGVGDFTTLLMSINPTLVTNVYPTTWTLYTVTISGLPAPTSGRIAFRYFVTNGGPSGANSDYIGIDNFIYTPYVCPAFTLTPNGGLPVGVAGTAYSNVLTQSGALGTPTFTLTGGALPAGLSLAANGTISGTPTATGTFNFSVTVSDASGCTGVGSYSIQINCPSNPTSLAGLPSLCTNDGIYTLVQGSPSGGIYSGTGVTAGTFDPSSGTQLITYDYTDPYGCAHSTSASIIVNAAPTVTQTSFTAVCEDAGSVALSGGLPAGGVYSGTGVAGNNFDASQGTQAITYTYVDGNGCSNSATETITVNALPAVSFTFAFAPICSTDPSFALSGGAPAGGIYSGAGVTTGFFDPGTAGIGVHTLTYEYTDGNGCSASATDDVTVNDCLSLSELNSSNVSVYPNPSSGVFTVTTENTDALTDLKVSDLSGRVIANGITNVNGELTIEITDAQTGVYVFSGKINGKSFAVRLMKD